MDGRRQAPRSLRTDAAAALDACLGWNSRLAARRIARRLEQGMAEAGMPLAQFWLMAQIASSPDDRLGALAGRMGLDPSSLSRNLKVIERRGWIEVALAEADQRRRMVWLTEQGARALEAALPAWRAAHEVLAAAMPPGLGQDLSRLVATDGEAGDDRTAQRDDGRRR